MHLLPSNEERPREVLVLPNWRATTGSTQGHVFLRAKGRIDRSIWGKLLQHRNRVARGTGVQLGGNGSQTTTDKGAPQELVRWCQRVYTFMLGTDFPGRVISVILSVGKSS